MKTHPRHLSASTPRGPTGPVGWRDPDRLLQFSVTVIAMIQGAVGPVFAQTGAKAAFYAESGATVPVGRPSAIGPAAPPPARPPQAYLALKYWVELTSRDGRQTQVTTDHVFSSGDRIALYVLSNRDGRLYVVNLGSTGRYALLFPSSAAGQSNAIRANVEYRIPPTSAIRFDENAGEEQLLVVLAPREAAPEHKAGAPLSAAEIARLVTAAPATGAKDLVLEESPADSHPASYAATPVASLKAGRMVVPIKLTHQ